MHLYNAYSPDLYVKSDGANITVSLPKYQKVFAVAGRNRQLEKSHLILGNQ
jgi:hypothetical protein